MPDTMRVVLEIDSGPAEKGAARGNAALKAFEDAAGKSGKAASASIADFGVSAERSAAKVSQSLERALTSLENKAALFNTTGLARIEEQRRQALSRFGADDEQVKRVNAAFEKIKTAQKAAEEKLGTNEFGQKLREAIEHPLQAAGGAAEAFAARFGVAGVVVAGATVAIAGAGLELFHLTHEFTEASRANVNFADRLDISVGAALRLKAAGTLLDVDVSTLEQSARRLGEALQDPAGAGKLAAESLHRLGVTTITTRGELRSSGEVFLEAFEALSKLPTAAARAAEGQALLGRGSKEVLPLIKRYEEITAVVDALGLALDPELVKRAAATDDKMHIASLALQKSASEIYDAFLPVLNIFSAIVVAVTTIERLRPKPVDVVRKLNQIPINIFDPSRPPDSPAAPGIGFATALQEQFTIQTAAATRAKQQQDATLEGIERTLKDKRKELDEINIKLRSRLDSDVRTQLESQAAGLRATISLEEDRKKSIGEVEAAVKKADETLKQAQAHESEGLGKLLAQQFILTTAFEKSLGLHKTSLGQLVEEGPLRTRLEAILSQSTVSETSGLEQILAKRKEALVELQKEPDARRRNIAILKVNQAAEIEFLTEINSKLVAAEDLADAANSRALARLSGFKGLQESFKKTLAELAESKAPVLDTFSFTGRAGFSPQETKNADDLEKIRLAALERTEDLKLTRLGETRDTELREVDLVGAAQLRKLGLLGTESIQQKIALEQRKAEIEQRFLNASFNLEIANIKRRTENEIQERQRALEKEIGHQLDPEQAANVRISEEIRSKQEIEKITTIHDASIAANRDNLTIRSVGLARDANQRLFDSLKDASGRVFDAMLTKGEHVWDVFKNAALSALRQIVSSTVAQGLFRLFAPFAGGGGGAAPVGGNAGILGSILGASSLGGTLPGIGPGRTASTFPGATGLPGPSSSTTSAASVTQLALAASALKNFFFNSGSIQTASGSATTAAGIGGIGGGLAGFATSPAAGLIGLALAVNGIKRGSLAGSAEAAGGGALSGAALFNALGLNPVTGAFTGAAVGGGLGLVQAGRNRGGFLGRAEAAGGGALAGAAIGFQFGGPIGALIGGVIGGIAGFVSTFFQTASQKVIEKVKAVYHLQTVDKHLADALVAIAKQNGFSLDMVILSQQGRDLIELYALSTGQSFGAFSGAPPPLVIAQRNGTLFQQPSFSAAGTPIGGSSSFLQPGGGIIPFGTVNQQSQAMSITLQIDGPATENLMKGQAISVVVNNPRAVQAASLRSQRGNSGRLENLSNAISPGLVLA